MAAPRLIRRLLAFHAGRDAPRLAIKQEHISSNAFAFFRGNPFLFWEDLPASILDDAPAVWICGDAHAENFGVYAANNGLHYFDLNDFDEAVLAPCAWDLLRLSTSLLLVAAPEKQKEVGRSWVQACVNGYRGALIEGQVQWVERALAKGPIGELLGSATRDRKTWLSARVHLGRRPAILIQNDVPPAKRKALAMSENQRRQVIDAVDEWLRAQDRPTKVIDCAHRIAGSSSLGLPRIVVLLKGFTAADSLDLLDLKAPPLAALRKRVRDRQPAWPSQAQRVLFALRRLPVLPPRALGACRIGDETFVVRELVPGEDKLDVARLAKTPNLMKAVAEDLGRVLAWSHLRVTGWRGSARGQRLVRWAEKGTWLRELDRLSWRCAQRARDNYNTFISSKVVLAEVGKPLE